MDVDSQEQKIQLLPPLHPVGKAIKHRLGFLVLQGYYTGIADEDKVEIEMSGHSAK